MISILKHLLSSYFELIVCLLRNILNKNKTMKINKFDIILIEYNIIETS